MKWFWKLTGGRPMKYLGFNFTDVVDGRAVNDYEDRLGRRWMANAPCSWFRVPIDRTRSFDVSSGDEH